MFDNEIICKKILYEAKVFFVGLSMALQNCSEKFMSLFRVLIYKCFLKKKTFARIVSKQALLQLLYLKTIL